MLTSMFMTLKSFALNQTMGAAMAVSNLTSKRSGAEGRREARRLLRAHGASVLGYYYASQFSMLAYEAALDALFGDDDMGEDEERIWARMTWWKALIASATDLFVSGLPEIADTAVKTGINAVATSAMSEDAKSAYEEAAYSTARKSTLARWNDKLVYTGGGRWTDGAGGYSMLLESAAELGEVIVLNRMEGKEWTEEEMWIILGELNRYGGKYIPTPFKGDVDRVIKDLKKRAKNEEKASEEYLNYY